jgi:hypothetical protein
MEKSLFQKLFEVNVNDRVEVKDNGKVKLSYLSWAWGWAEVKKVDPEATYKIHEFPMINPNKTDVIPGVFVPYLETETGFYVTVSVTINGHTLTETLPVMDEKNAPLGTTMMAWSKQVKGQKEEVKTPTPTSFEINKSHKRCLVKAIALHGLGLYIYAGEDLPEIQVDPIEQKQIGLIKVNVKSIASLRKVDELEVLRKSLETPTATYETLTTLSKEQATKLIEKLDKWRVQAEEGNKKIEEPVAQ